MKLFQYQKSQISETPKYVFILTGNLTTLKMPIAEKKDKGQFDKLASVTTESIQYFQFSFGIQSKFDAEQI